MKKVIDMLRVNHTPPITRVHTLFRLRTVLNAVTELHKRGETVTDKEIAGLLAETRLSKYKPEKLEDRIGRRARDHLETLLRMGLVWRTKVKGRFDYRATPAGEQLFKRYGFMDECPKDSFEEAVFISRLMRMKMTNPYERKFIDFRTRPCLTALYSLSQTKLHLYHLGIILGEKKADPYLNPAPIDVRVKEFSLYEPNEHSVGKFLEQYGIENKEAKSIRRDTKPILDWCRQLNLVSERHDWYTLTDRGKVMLEHYKDICPIWYADLGDVPQAKSALLLLYDFLRSSGIPHQFAPEERIRVGLFEGNIKDLLIEIEKNVGVALFDKSYTRLIRDVDFSLWYDIPPRMHEDTLTLLKDLLNKHGVTVDAFIKEVELKSILKLEGALRRENAEFKQARADSISEAIEVKLPIEVIPTPGVFSAFRSPFESECFMLLRLLGFNAQKYQGLLKDFASRSFSRFAENNPDILIANGFYCLVECKSIGEWRERLRVTKNVSNEMWRYQMYTKDVNVNSAVFIYEGTIDRKSKRQLIDQLVDARKIVVISRRYLLESLRKPERRKVLKNLMKRPEVIKPLARILHHS